MKLVKLLLFPFRLVFSLTALVFAAVAICVSLFLGLFVGAGTIAVLAGLWIGNILWDAFEKTVPVD